MKVIVVLSDSLNRHYLPVYGNQWVHAPNIARLADMSVTFDNHWQGSAPCIPARRDMWSGRLHFLEREWGGLEPFDISFPLLLREAGVYCHMETDHVQYFRVGGENYCTQFDAWAYHRGQAGDPYVSRVSPPPEPEHLGIWEATYAKNSMLYSSAAEYSTPRTFQGALDWLRANQEEDNCLLWVEVFDPHEPFDCPQEYLQLYDDDWQGPLYYYSGYERVDGDSEATKHLQRRYAATLTMMDEWFGKLLDELERQNGFEDTLIIFTTDHGHLLGGKNVTGKNKWHAWNELAHLPLIVHLPGSRHAGERRDQLTQNVDIMPTIMDYFGVPLEVGIHGESWKQVLENNAPVEREAVLYGWYGQTINLTDGKHTYFRAPVREDNQPLYRYFLAPGTLSGRGDVCSKTFYEEATLGHFLPYTDYAVIRARVDRPRSSEWADTRLYDIESDYGQTVNLAGTEIEEQYERLLVSTMREVDAPSWQYQRVGLASGKA
jgi:arylsulfatase A-like enzyme